MLIPSAQNAELKSALQGPEPLFEGHLAHAERVQSAYWELVGREKERIRIQQIFRDEVFSPILIAVFAIAAAKEATNAAEQTEFLQRASDLLTSTFEVVGAAL